MPAIFFIHMTLYIRFISIIFFASCLPFTLSGQNHTVESDGDYPQNALADAKQLYSRTLKGQSALYNGRQYNFRYLEVKGTPFYGGFNWNRGNILYDNQLYEGINMKFDIYMNILVIDYYDSEGKFYYLRLQDKRINTFDWPGHHFIHIKNDSSEADGLPSGFYDVLYDGNIRVLARYTKTINKNSSQADYQLKVFREKDYFFIEKDMNIYQIKSKRSLLEAFVDKKQKIKSFIKTNKLKFKGQSGWIIAEVAAFYDSIND